MRPADTVTDRRRLGAAPARARCSRGAGRGGRAGRRLRRRRQEPGRRERQPPRAPPAATRPRRRPRERRRHALSGGGPSSGSGGGAPRSGFAIATGNPQKALKLSECMRANGVPNFPDPNGQGVIQGSGIDPNSSAVPEGPADVRQERSAAASAPAARRRSPRPRPRRWRSRSACAPTACPSFPDPQFGSGGGIRIRIHASAGSGGGLDPSSPIFQKAQQTCGSLLPGASAREARAREHRGPDRSAGEALATRPLRPRPGAAAAASRAGGGSCCSWSRRPWCWS